MIVTWWCSPLRRGRAAGGSKLGRRDSRLGGDSGLSGVTPHTTRWKEVWRRQMSPDPSVEVCQ